MGMVSMALANVEDKHHWFSLANRVSVYRGQFLQYKIPHRWLIVRSQGNLTHRGRVTHICVSRLNIMGSSLAIKNKFQWNVNRNLYIFIQENACERPFFLSLNVLSVFLWVWHLLYFLPLPVSWFLQLDNIANLHTIFALVIVTFLFSVTRSLNMYIS